MICDAHTPLSHSSSLGSSGSSSSSIKNLPSDALASLRSFLGDDDLARVSLTCASELEDLCETRECTGCALRLLLSDHRELCRSSEVLSLSSSSWLARSMRRGCRAARRPVCRVEASPKGDAPLLHFVALLLQLREKTTELPGYCRRPGAGASFLVRVGTESSDPVGFSLMELGSTWNFRIKSIEGSETLSVAHREGVAALELDAWTRERTISSVYRRDGKLVLDDGDSDAWLLALDAARQLLRSIWENGGIRATVIMWWEQDEDMEAPAGFELLRSLAHTRLEARCELVLY